MINNIVLDNDSSTSNPNDLPENVDIVYYFYTNYRCETCELIEKYTGESVKEYFKNQLVDGTLIWKTVNTDEKGNEHFLDDYELYTKSVVLVRIRDGEEKSWKNLEEVWTYYDDETEFKTYVTNEVKAFIGNN